MEYGVFQIDNENKLVLRSRFITEEEAIDFAQTGTNMVILKIYI
jgi:hypothetical protein